MKIVTGRSRVIKTDLGDIIRLEFERPLPCMNGESFQFGGWYAYRLSPLRVALWRGKGWLVNGITTGAKTAVSRAIARLRLRRR